METRENMNPIGVPKNLVLSTCCIHGIDLSICPMAEGFIRVGESNRLFWGTFHGFTFFPALIRNPRVILAKEEILTWSFKNKTCLKRRFVRKRKIKYPPASIIPWLPQKYEYTSCSFRKLGHISCINVLIQNEVQGISISTFTANMTERQEE